MLSFHCKQNTIRREINITFLVTFLVMFLLVAGGYRNFRSLRRSIQFFVMAEDLNAQISEVTRYERIFFKLAETSSREESIRHARAAQALLKKNHSEFSWALGDDRLKRVYQDLDRFVSLFNRLDPRAAGNTDQARLRQEIQDLSRQLSAVAGQNVQQKLEEVRALLQQMLRFPLISLVVMVLLLVVTIYFIDRKILGPLERITGDAQQIARGTFHRIPETRKNKSEICNMVAALNRMMDEIESRQDQLVQQCKIAAVGTLTSGIAHELNNPINNLTLIIESLIEDGMEMDRDERMRLYQEAMDQADRASETVKNLLEFSRATHPKLEEVDIRELLDKIARLIKNEMQFHNIRFSLEAPDDLPRMYLDRGGLQQVFLNLFLNAVQAMGNRGKLEVRAGLTEDRREVRIDVKDNGPGISPEHLDQIFDPFFTTKKEGEGTGLGLSVSYNIIKKLGGHISVESTPGQGARFSIFLPLKKPRLIDGSPGPVSASTAGARKKTIFSGG
jgi:signal transduction histidine kinase